MEITNKNTLIKASDEDIIEFFSETVFEGIYSSEIKSKNSEYYKGHIHSIKLNGSSTNIIGSFINVPKNALSIPEGPCTFKCRVKEGDIRISPSQIKISLSPRTLRPSSTAQQFASDAEIEKIRTRLRLTNNQFIGQFAPQSNSPGWYRIIDIRNTDFTKIEDRERGVKDLIINFKSQKDFNRFAYYKFTWVLLETEPLKFGIDLRKEIIPIFPKDIVNCLYEGIMRYPAGAAKKIARSLDTLKKQLTQSGKEVFIYELLQNANDYPRYKRINGESTVLPVEVEFHITENFLTFQHTGEYFNPRNIAAICDINDGEKADNTDAIGYKGIGFKTVFLDNDYVLLKTGKYSFRFDKSATDVINTPWQILPIWSENYEIDNDVKSIFNLHPNEEFRVKFALQPRDKSILTDEDRDDKYIDLFSRVFESERVILFIPNIKKVSIYIDGQDEPIVREKDNKDWCVSDSLVDDIPEDVTAKINDVLENPDSLRSDGYEKIPEKYMNFRKTAVKFACKKDGRKLIPVYDAILYCYLPAKRADWGFNFLMNTDMVPNGQRDDIEDIELNHVIARIAGRQFFYWIKQLIESGEYDLDSIFSLIPDFEECKKRRVYKMFIEEFQEEFEALIKEEPFVPCVNKDGNKTFECIDNIINDMTRMTANGVISDGDFINLMELGDCSLPVDELRQSESFMDFLYKHSPSGLDINVDDVVDKCEETDFQIWLADVQNNTKFIKYWLANKEISKFSKKKIFIEYEGELFTAGDLYYNFDSNCQGIEFLRRFIPHLCDYSKASFEGEDNWDAFVNECFQSFSASSMITTYILPNKDAMALLNEPSNSVAFYRYLAIMDVDLKTDSTKIPYITENGEVSIDYSNYLYFFNDDAHSLTCEKWLGKNVVNVLSHIYFDGLSDEKKAKLISIFARLGFHEFVKELFITTVVVGDANFREKVNAAIENNYTANKAFVDYVFECEAQLKADSNSFKDYVLRCVDINNSEVYLCNDDVRYFNQEAFAQNSTFEDNLHHVWLQPNMMYALSNAYFDECGKEEAKKLESFLRLQFGVKTFTDKSFFTDVVIKNKTVIYASIVDETTMLNFLEYLKRDAERLFDGSMSFNDIKDMPLLAYDGTIIRTREVNIQYIEYNEDAKILCEKTWSPKMYVILSQKYTSDFSQDMRQLFKITKFDLNSITDILAQNASLHQSVNVVANNVDFWRWVRSKQKLIALIDKFKTIPLLDKNNVLTNSASLYISDTYQQERIESLVTKYVKTAKFVSSLYIETTYDSEKAEWIKLFKKLGLKSDNKDILFSDILPNLASIDANSLDSVIAMMTKHLKDLKDNWAERKHQIVQLKVRTQSGVYMTIDQVTIINLDEDSVSEPFKYITLFNEVNPDILKANRELLFAISAEFQNRNLITTKQMWIDAKVKTYLAQFTADEKSIADIHIQFVREVAKIQSEYDINDGLRKQIKYRVKSDETTYKFAHELTLGSAYSPTCDFEANGVDGVSYLSDEYIFEGNKDTIKTYFKTENLHHNMTREDLKHLANRTFACYFWSRCFSRRLSEYETWIEEGCFNNLVCIPTENSVQKPELLYAPHIAAVYAVRAKVPQWGEKVPCKAIVESIDKRDARDLFEKLHFCTILSFEDCLYYLARVSDRREDESDCRRTVINWMLSAPTYDRELVAKYRGTPTSTWRNGKGQKKHISELFAIHPDAKQERNIFWGDEFVLQTTSFPSSAVSFEKVCQILQIECLTKKDFVATPIGKTDETAKMIPILRPRLLVLAAIENPDRFQQLYEKYNEVISKYRFDVCEKIDLGYKTVHNDVMRIYNDDSHLYYVGSWLHNRTFTKFCGSLRTLVGCYVDTDVCEDVLDINNTVESCIEKYCSSLAYDENFRAYLKSLDLEINIEPEEDEPSEVENEYYNDATNVLSNSETEGINETPVGHQQFGNAESVGETSEAMEHVYDYSDNEVGKKLMRSTNTSLTSAVPNEDEGDIKSPQTTTKSAITSSQQPTAEPHNQPTEAATAHESSSATEDKDDDFDQYDTYQQVDENEIDYIDHLDETVEVDVEMPNTSQTPSNKHGKDYDPDNNDYMGAVDRDKDYQPVGDRPYKPRVRKHPKNFTKEEVERLRSHGTPLELESLPPTEEEIDLLAQCNIKPEQIADTNYLAQLRLYQNLKNEMQEEPEESMEAFVHNANDVTVHKLKDGKYIHTCSAARGVMYISPTIWNIMDDEKGRICVYLDGQAKNFAWIKTKSDFLKLVEKDDVVIKITGHEKVGVVRELYSGILKGVKGTAYTLIRVAARTNMDAVFAHYVGTMAEAEDGNDDYTENDY